MCGRRPCGQSAATASTRSGRRPELPQLVRANTGEVGSTLGHPPIQLPDAGAKASAVTGSVGLLPEAQKLLRTELP